MWFSEFWVKITRSVNKWDAYQERTDTICKSVLGTDALIGIIEVQLTDQFRFGYAYDRTMNNFKDVAPSSHEIMIRYEFGFGKNRILTPRYF